MWVRARKLCSDTEARFRSYEQIGGRSGYNYGHSLWQCNLGNELMRSGHESDEKERVSFVSFVSFAREGNSTIDH